MRTFVLLALVGLMMSGTSILQPTLALYGQTFATSTTLVSMLITLFGVGRLVANGPAGYLSQVYGRRRLLAVGLVILLVTSIAAANAGSIYDLLIWRFAQGVGAGIYMTTSLASVADMSTDRNRGRIMSYYQISVMLGASVGPVLGGALAGRWGLAAPFWAYAVIAAVGIALVPFAVRAPLGVTETITGKLSGFGPELRSPAFILVYAASFLLFFIRSGVQWQLLPLFATERFGMGIGTLGAVVSASMLGTLVLLPAAGRIIDAVGSKRVIVWSMACIGLSAAMMALLPNVPAFWITNLALGLSSGVLAPAIATYAVAMAPKHLYGPAAGMQRMAGDLGFVMGPVAMGLLLDQAHVDVSTAILFNGALLVVASGVFFVRIVASDR